MNDASAIISNAGTAFQHLPAEAQRADVVEMARRLVSTDVRYCVSGLVSFLNEARWDGQAVDVDDLTTLAWRQPNASDFREAARDHGILARATVRIEDEATAHWYLAAAEDGGESEDGDSYDGTVAGAWRALFDAASLDYPDGAECLEHWLVTDWMAERLEAKGEAVAYDVAGLTIWGRCTSGQAIYADAVIEAIARDILTA